MWKKIKLFVIMTGIVAANACDSGGDWSGKISGTTIIQKEKIRGAGSVTIEPPETVLSGNGTVSLEHGLDYHARLGKDTPLPDCFLTFSPSGKPNEYKLTEPNRVYTGETNDGKGCRGIVEAGGSPTDVYFDGGEVTLSDGGEVKVFLQFRPVGSNAENRTLIFNGKKGWF